MNLPQHAGVVVIGGGVMGVSAAFHLAEAGVQDVLLVERAELGAGSTSKAAGGVRLQFSDELNIHLAKRSLDAYERFQERPGADIGLHQDGYLFLLTTPDDVARFERSVALQQELGVPSRLLTPQEAGQHCPIATTDDVLAAAFCPRDGHATPEAVVTGYATAARALGVTIARGCEVTGIEVVDGAVAAVETTRGRVTTDTVVCAAGAWSAAIGDLVGVALPVVPYRRHIVFTDPLAWLPDRLPLTIDFATSFYFHREGQGLLMGMAEPTEPGFDETLDPAWVERLVPQAVRRVPQLEDASIAGGWGGLYEVTPDHNALIGRARQVEGFVYATGFSGHGFLQGPAVGELVRDLVLDRPTFVDVSPLSADRFALAAGRPEYHVI